MLFIYRADVATPGTMLLVWLKTSNVDIVIHMDVVQVLKCKHRGEIHTMFKTIEHWSLSIYCIITLWLCLLKAPFYSSVVIEGNWSRDNTDWNGTDGLAFCLLDVTSVNYTVRYCQIK